MTSQQCRYMLITVIVIITIFIYVIYSTNDMQVPGRLLHPSPPIDEFRISDASTLTGSGGGGSSSSGGRDRINGSSSFNGSSSGNGFSSNTNSHSSNNNNINPRSSSLDESIKRQINTEISNTSNPYSEYVPPQSSIASDGNRVVQTVINNVDTSDSPAAKSNIMKMPKNHSNQSTTAAVSSGSSTTTVVAAPQPKVASNIMTGGVLDTAKGIPTSVFYVPGHIESNSDLCPEEGTPVRLLILVTSAPTHREARLAIRQTWGHYNMRRDVSIGFILGATGNTTIEDELDAENYMYNDMIRGHFIDSYNNLTLKTVSMLEWVDKYCPEAKFVLKTDDDMFINIPKLLTFIDKHDKSSRTIYGRLAKKWKPIRNVKSKYYVSTKQFSPPVFPSFTTGPAYLMTADCVHDLYEKSLNQTYLKLEDVYTTGIVAQTIGIKRVQVNEFLNRRIAFNPCNLRKAISVHMVKINEQFDLWKKLLDTNVKCK